MSNTVRCKFSKARSLSRGARMAEPPVSQRADTTRASRAARMLALAHHVERLIEAGELTGYADAARALGLTRARLTQVMNLLLLAPENQRRLLTGASNATERSLRAIVQEPSWAAQCQHLSDVGPSPGSEAKP